MEEWHRELAAWRDYYAFAGAAAATLMGLMFVVVSLGQRTLATEEGSRATRGFFTPIIVFFATIIVVTMLMLVPHPSAIELGVLLAVVGAGGLIYMVASGAHSMWRSGELGVDDLIWYVLVPYLCYAAIAVAGVALWRATGVAFVVAGVAMLLLLITGIRNAWDLVVYNIQRGER